jgi:NAD(P)-dependent dehydrogenase (short-subunit alcohol dehydrogenase family)
MFELTGKIAAVTGAGSGIGQAIAVQFTKAGAKVAVLDISAAAAHATVEQVLTAGGYATAFSCDVSNAASVSAAFADVDAKYGRLDILVNNAGIAHIGTVESTTEADLDRIYAVNVKGVFLCSQAAVPVLLRSGAGAVILNMASIASLIGVPDRFAYMMSKGAVLTMTRSIAADYIKRIRCNCICPARVHTPFVDAYLAKNYPGHEQEMFQKLSEYQPMGRMGTADEVASLAVYLCSDQASFITGQAYPIDGGVLVL